ncbi:hypothetical protein O0S10_03050 [Methanocorpusculum sp. MG]|uniref:Uncharacterized protein n=1 Tax=Methanocorpusculum petauri TaxID=3002863 RepID=A0ABT4IGH0_9EURY|nr:hypothetical protein [Methanocorpusculum petauri]MCZ0860208.1 hypothetical protein [Methanocorpusculum petauri]
MRRIDFFCGLVILCVMLLVFAAGCVGEPPAPEEGGYFITIDPVPDQILGTAFVVSGTTNLPLDSKLLYEQVWDDWYGDIDITPRLLPNGSGFVSAVITVESGNGSVNTWKILIDSSSYMYPKTYLIWIDALDLNYSAPRAVALYNITKSDGSMITPVPTPRLNWTVPVPELGGTVAPPIPSPTLTPPPQTFADDGTPLYTFFDVRKNAHNSFSTRKVVEYLEYWNEKMGWDISSDKLIAVGDELEAMAVVFTQPSPVLPLLRIEDCTWNGEPYSVYVIDNRTTFHQKIGEKLGLTDEEVSALGKAVSDEQMQRMFEQEMEWRKNNPDIETWVAF